MSLTNDEKGRINAALGYSAEVCEPNGKPITVYITDRWGLEQRARVYEAVEKIVEQAVTEAKAEALREAADETEEDGGAWDVLALYVNEDAHPYALHGIKRWLRERAACSTAVTS